MKLWLLVRKDGEWGHNQYLGFIIRAPSEDRALAIAVEQDPNTPNWIAEVVTPLGKEGIILDNYNARD